MIYDLSLAVLRIDCCIPCVVRKIRNNINHIVCSPCTTIRTPRTPLIHLSVTFMLIYFNEDIKYKKRITFTRECTK